MPDRLGEKPRLPDRTFCLARQAFIFEGSKTNRSNGCQKILRQNHARPYRTEEISDLDPHRYVRAGIPRPPTPDTQISPHRQHGNLLRRPPVFAEPTLHRFFEAGYGAHRSVVGWRSIVLRLRIHAESTPP